jgi:serine/threonine-protein kinase
VTETDPRIGAILDGRYQIVDELAAGGMGVVYRGERLGLGRGVAIKFLHAHIAADKSFRERFAREAKAMGQLQHPNCASVIDFGFHEQEPYVVMDLVAGESLRDLLDRGRLPAWRALAIMRQILAGLAHAHAQGITHRDIKPDNVMVDGAGAFGDQVRILDFGLAKLRQSTSELTTGFVVGTPSYMAPEQTLAQPVDERTDIYASGIVLFEMLTGEKPFRADEAIQVLRMQRETPPPRLAQIAPDARFSDELEGALLQALAKDPGHRFSSAAAFATALDHVPEAATRPASTPPTITPATPAPALARPARAEARHDARGAMGTAPTAWSPAPAQPAGASPTEFLGTGQIEVVEADRDRASRGRDFPGGAVTVPGGGPVPQHAPQAERPDRAPRLPFTDPSIDPPPGMAGTAASMAGTAPGMAGTAASMAGTAPGMAGTAASMAGTAPGMAGTAAHMRAVSEPVRAQSAGTLAEPSRAFSQAQPGRSRTLWIGIGAGAAVIGLLVVVGLLGDGKPEGSAGADDLAAAAGSTGEDLVVEYDLPAEGGEAEARAAGGEDAQPAAAGDEALAANELDAADPAGLEDTGTDPEPRDPARAGVKSANQVLAGPPSLAQARALLAEGKISQARNLLEKLRRQDRDNPEVHYWLGRSYFKGLWVQDGLDAYRDAIALDPGYRNNAGLIESAVSGLANDSHHGAVARFLIKDIGRPARSALQSMASSHYREEVRERASRALRQIPAR